MRVFSGTSQDFIDKAIAYQDIALEAWELLAKGYAKGDRDLVRAAAVLARTIVFPDNWYREFKSQREFVSGETSVSSKIIRVQSEVYFEAMELANEVIRIIDGGPREASKLSYAIDDLLGDLLATQGFDESIDDFVAEAQPILDAIMEEEHRKHNH